MKVFNVFDKKSNKIKGGIKMSKRLHIFLMLLVATLLITAGCGGSGTTADSSLGEKTAKVSLTFQFPDSGDATNKSVMSNSTTHILINAWQWKKNKDGTIVKVNYERMLINKSNPTATLDLYPTYTNICATQWEGDPNLIYTSKKLETVCSFGILNPGPNTINLTMIRGTWTLQTPLAFNNTTSLTAFSLLRKSYPNYNEPYMTPTVTDTTYSSYYSPAQAHYNYGSEYNVAIKTKNMWDYLPPADAIYSSKSFGFYSNFFGMGDTAPLFFIAKDETVVNSQPKGYVLFSLPKKTDADGWYRQEKEFMEDKYYNDYYNQNLVLVKRKAEVKIEKWNGTQYNINETSTILDGCVPSTVNAQTMNLCGANETSVQLPVLAFNQYSGVTNSYKITAKGTVSGVNICLDQNKYPIFDNTGALTGCYDNNAGVNYDPAATTTCLSGTLNTTNVRCELTVQDACTQLGGTYDTTYSVCRIGNATYDGYNTCGKINAGPSSSSNQYDSSVNVCYNYGIKGSVVCYNGGTYVYSVTENRCESTLQGTCLYYNGLFDAAQNPPTCTQTSIMYVGGINFIKNLTASGVGKLDADVSFTAAKATTSNKAKFKLSLPKK